MSKKSKRRQHEEPNEITEMWREIKEENKELRHAKQNWARELLEEWCPAHEVELTVISDYHFRLAKNGHKIDVFPQSQRHFNLSTKKWGKFKDLIQFVENQFKISG